MTRKYEKRAEGRVQHQPGIWNLQSDSGMYSRSRVTVPSRLECALQRLADKRIGTLVELY